MSKKQFALLFVVGVMLLSVGWRLRKHRVGHDITIADKFTSAKAANLNAKDVRDLRFTGPHFMRFANDPIILQDKAEIDRCLTALRHATSRRQEALDGVDILEIELLPRKGEAVPSQLFFFNLQSELSSFGPEFYREALSLKARIAQENQKRKAARANAAFSMVNVKDDDALTGEFLMNVATRSEYTYGDITLKVDGTLAAWGGSTGTPDGSGLVQFSVETDAFANGSHTLTVEDKRGNTETRKVTFRNEIWNSSVDALFDTTPGVKDAPAACAITGTLTRRSPWTVRIMNSDDPPVSVRTFSGNSTDIHVAWDGKDAKGHEVENGPYNVLLSCREQTLTHVTNKNFR